MIDLSGDRSRMMGDRKSPNLLFIIFASLIVGTVVVLLGCLAFVFIGAAMSQDTPHQTAPTLESEYIPVTGKVWRDVKIYTGNKMVFEILGGSNDCPSMPSGKGVKVLYPSGREEWKDRGHIVSSGLYLVYRDDPAISRAEWIEFSDCR